jgi:BirA family biotin operon repressor/biotin-[acetyl-CoA-carboxylase] ligase
MQVTINSTFFIGKSIIELERVDSTNTYLKQLVSNNEVLKDGMVVTAYEQYSGRGQVNNKWLSEPGKNLTLSILLNPSFVSVKNQFDLNKAISLGVLKFATHFLGNKVKIKWSNDIYWEDNKIGGILIETFLSGNNIKYAVVGIGININQDYFSNNINASSFSLITGKKFSLEHCRNILFEYIEFYYLKLKDGDMDEINEDYHNALYRLNIKDFYRANGEIFTAELIGVTQQGLLRLVNHDTEQLFNFKEVEFI